MQQPMNQSEPIGGQQSVSQPMLLCPVRVLCDTQVWLSNAVPSNEQQIVFTQNLPPWAPNQETSSPMLYNQNISNFMMHAVQPQMDQNQLYLPQNYANFQLQQMVSQNHQEPTFRPTMHVATNLLPNMMQIVQPSIQSNERIITQNSTGQMQGNTQNIIPGPINASRQLQVPMNQAVEVARQMYMNARPQISHQMTMQRPVMALNQIPTMHAVPNIQNVQIQQNMGQTYMQNVSQCMPQNMSPVRQQILSVQKIQDTNKVTVRPPSVRNVAQNYNCRPTQPRRRFQTPNNPVQPSHIPVQAPQMQVPQMQAPQMQTPQMQAPQMQAPQMQVTQMQIPQMQYTQERVNSHQVVSNLAVSRKRKSESPDEVQNKIAVPLAPKPMYKNHQPGIIITRLGNETAAVHNQGLITNSLIQMNPNAITVSENVDPTNVIITDKAMRTLLANESDKLIRNTVFTQARGRVLQDKVDTPHVVEKEPENVQNTAEIRATVETDRNTVMSEITTEKASGTPAVQIKAQTGTVDNKIKQMLRKKSESKLIQLLESKPITIQTEEVSKEPKESEPEKELVKEQNSIEAKKVTLEAADINDVKQDILTHVVDGYVIQESNFAFPIRKPLREKTIQLNSKSETESTNALKEYMKEEMQKNPEVDVQLLPFHYLLLHCEQKKQEEEKDDGKKLNPFTDLLHSTVKSWTVEDLSNHLQKYDWNDTVSVFQDHEIDGESLFLVSKTQLVSIGVTEEIADTICSFVKS